MKSLTKMYISGTLIATILFGATSITATAHYSSYDIYKLVEVSDDIKPMNTVKEVVPVLNVLDSELITELKFDVLEPLEELSFTEIIEPALLDEVEVIEETVLMVEVVELVVEQEPIDNKQQERLQTLETLSISQADIQAMQQMVEAEGGVCNYNEKLALANSFINKTLYERTVNSNITVKQILENANQYEPVLRGTYYTVTPSEDSIRAVQEAINGTDNSGGAIFFWAKYFNSSWHESQVSNGKMIYARNDSEDKHHFITFSN